MQYTFDYLEDPSYGHMGYSYRQRRYKLDRGGINVATSGKLVAHDLLEHPNIAIIGSIGDELEALGGVLYMRGQFGDISRTVAGSK